MFLLPDARAHDQSQRQETALLQQAEVRKAVKRSVVAGSSFDRFLQSAQEGWGRLQAAQDLVPTEPGTSVRGVLRGEISLDLIAVDQWMRISKHQNHRSRHSYVRGAHPWRSDRFVK